MIRPRVWIAIVAALVLALGAAGFLWRRSAQARAQSALAASVPDPKLTGLELPVQEVVTQARQDVLDHPTSYKSWAWFATVLDAHHFSKMAVVAYRRAFELGPEDPSLSYNLAILVESMGETSEGLARFQKFSQSFPTFPPVHFRIGRCLALQGDMEGAAKSYRKALELDPNLSIARRGLGQVLFALDDPRSAKAELERVAALSPNDGPTQSALAQVYRRLGDAAHAEDAMQRSRDAKDILVLPDPVQYIVTKAARTAKLSWARSATCIAEGDYAGALEDLKIVLRTRSQDPVVHDRLAEVYRRLGQTASAEGEVAEARRLRGEN
jgi:Flp pilus assembly protein TadD